MKNVDISKLSFLKNVHNLKNMTSLKCLKKRMNFQQTVLVVSVLKCVF